MEYKLAAVMLVLFQLTSMISGQSLSGCGDTKGCFYHPRSCTGKDCTVYMTWQTVKDKHTEFALWGQALGYVAFGLRPENATGRHTMVPADVYACTKNREVRRSQNTRRYDTHKLDSLPREIPSGTITDNSTEFVDNVISCIFTRKLSSEDDNTFYNIGGNNSYLIILAIGDSINKTGTIEGYKHKRDWTASRAINLQQHVDLSLEADDRDDRDVLEKAHASLMVIAWVGLASIGITLARYFKPMWPSSKLLGKAVWFTLHRACMVVCVLCTIVGLVLIFIEEGFETFVETDNLTKVLHAILGIIVTILIIINPIMAIFRPPPGDDRRPVFNWAHWGVGSSAYVIGLVTIFLGIGYNQSLLSGLPRYVFFIMIAFVVFHCLLWILLQIQQCMTESQGRLDDVPLQPVQDGGDNILVVNPNSNGSFAKTLLLIIYSVGVIIVVVVFVIGFITAGN